MYSTYLPKLRLVRQYHPQQGFHFKRVAKKDKPSAQTDIAPVMSEREMSYVMTVVSRANDIKSRGWGTESLIE